VITRCTEPNERPGVIWLRLPCVLVGWDFFAVSLVWVLVAFGVCAGACWFGSVLWSGIAFVSLVVLQKVEG
jgi:hypothetical protein